MNGAPSPRTPWRLLAAAGALLVVASCASVPRRSSAEWLGVLPSDATLYASLAVPDSASFIKKALKDAGPEFQDIGSLVDMTKRLVCSVTLAPGAPARFSVVALGGYPSGIIGLRLSGNKEWKQSSSAAGSYWQWSKAGLQLSIPNNALLLASNGSVDTLLTRWTSPVPLTVPPDMAGDMESSDLVLYLPQLPGGLGQSDTQSGMRIPIQEVWMRAVRTPGGYTAGGTANTASEREARLLTLVLRLGIVAWMRSENIPQAAERLKSISVTSDGMQVKMAGIELTEDEIIPVFLSLVKGLSPSEPAEATPVDGVSGASGEPAEEPAE